MPLIQLQHLTKHLEQNRYYRIGFIGDSLTSAEWLHPNWREIVEYVIKAELERETGDWKIYNWGIRCINAGFDGATTEEIYEKTEKYLIPMDPDIIIHVGGKNDVWQNKKPSFHKKNIEKLLALTHSHNIPLVYCTSVPSSHDEIQKKYQPYINKAVSLFPQKSVLFINLFEELQKYDLNIFFTQKSGGNSLLGIKEGEADYIHPNVLGNAHIAKLILKKAFGISFDPEKYLQYVHDDWMYPKY